jgi:hypothetical protein
VKPPISARQTFNHGAPIAAKPLPLERLSRQWNPGEIQAEIEQQSDLGGVCTRHGQGMIRAGTKGLDEDRIPLGRTRLPGETKHIFRCVRPL